MVAENLRRGPHEAVRNTSEAGHTATLLAPNFEPRTRFIPFTPSSELVRMNGDSVLEDHLPAELLTGEHRPSVIYGNPISTGKRMPDGGYLVRTIYDTTLPGENLTAPHYDGPIPGNIYAETAAEWPHSLPVMEEIYDRLNYAPRAGGTTKGMNPEDGTILHQTVDNHVHNIGLRFDRQMAAHECFRQVIDWRYGRAIIRLHDAGEAGGGDFPQSATPEQYEVFHAALAGELNQPQLVQTIKIDGQEGMTTGLTEAAFADFSTRIQELTTAYQAAVAEGVRPPDQTAYYQYLFDELRVPALFTYDDNGLPAGITDLQFQPMKDVYFQRFKDLVAEAEQKYAVTKLSQIPDPQERDVSIALYTGFEGRKHLLTMDDRSLQEKFGMLYPELTPEDLRHKLLQLFWFMRVQDIYDEVEYFTSFGGWQQASYPPEFKQTAENVRNSLNKSLQRLLEPALYLMQVLDGEARFRAYCYINQYLSQMEAHADNATDVAAARNFFKEQARASHGDLTHLAEQIALLDVEKLSDLPWFRRAA